MPHFSESRRGTARFALAEGRKSFRCDRFSALQIFAVSFVAISSRDEPACSSVSPQIRVCALECVVYANLYSIAFVAEPGRTATDTFAVHSLASVRAGIVCTLPYSLRYTLAVSGTTIVRRHFARWRHHGHSFQTTSELRFLFVCFFVYCPLTAAATSALHVQSPLPGSPVLLLALAFTLEDKRHCLGLPVTFGIKAARSSPAL